MARLVKDKLLKYDYYLNQLGLLLKMSYGVPEELKVEVNIAKSISDFFDELFDLLGYSKLENNENNVFLDINKINDMSTTESDLLDKIAEIVGGARNSRITYEFNGVSYTEDITLNNNELLTYIYTQVIRNNYLGTRKEINNLYNKLTAISGIELSVMTQENGDSGYAIIHMNSNHAESGQSELTNLEKMFLAGKFTLESLGISYSQGLLKFGLGGVWLDINALEAKDNNTWDIAVWQ